VTLPRAEFGQRLCALVERWQRARLEQLAPQPGHAVPVRGDGGKARVVQRTAEPLVESGITAPARAQPLVLELEAAELTLLFDPQLGGRQRGLVQAFQALPRGAQ